MMRNSSTIRQKVVAAALAGAFVLATDFANAQRSAVPSKPDDRTIAHVLNRAGFGARPGDVARVRQIGLAAYIDQQLHPERIPDGALAARLSEFPTLGMSTSDLAEGYFNPAAELRRQAELELRRQRDDAERLRQAESARVRAIEAARSTSTSPASGVVGSDGTRGAAGPAESEEQASSDASAGVTPAAVPDGDRCRPVFPRWHDR